MNADHSARNWYQKAEIAYREQHQGCPWCGGAHRVSQSIRGCKHTYSCQRCDFQAAHDLSADRYHFVPGEEVSTVSDTMLEQPIANLLS